MIGFRRVLEIIVIFALLWYCISLKFILGFAAGAILAGEIYATLRGRSDD